MGFNLWWRWNDGLGGHAWLSDGDMAVLVEEMVAQGMAWDEGRGPTARTGIPVRRLTLADEGGVTAQQIEEALAAAEPEPGTLADPKLWSDWLAFLDGARHKGGLVVR